ncbi:lectin-like domain-containing protein, partial [Lacticaseibacillus hulanensis]|uniref:lectin-like domain-containing protein n=1 Tax=Lacticaseibacillus hulanensis TaxID=2493111 RepID=UPI0013E3724E
MAKNNSSHKVQRESKEHYKMYKAGKQWLFAAIFSVMVGTGLATQTHVSAATDDGDTQAQETTDPANAELQQQTVKLSNSADTAKTESTSTAAATKDDAAATATDAAAADTAEAAEAADAAPAADKTTTDDALNTKAVKRTINFVDENGKTVASPVVQQVQFTRSSADSEWVATGHAQFDALSTPNVLGMTTTTKIAATNVHATDDDSTLTVTYTETSTDSRAKALAAAPKAAVTYKTADATSDDKTDGPVVSTITADMAQNLFVKNRDASWDDTNVGTAKMVNLGKTDEMGSPIGSDGNIMMANRIDVSQNFHLEATVTLGTEGGTGGDGLGIGLYGGESLRQKGEAGGAMGIGGIANAFGFKLDTHYNASNDLLPSYGVDPAEFSDVVSGSGNAFGAFMYTDDNTAQQVYQDTADASSKANPLEVKDAIGAQEPLTIDYDAAKKEMTVSFAGQTWTKNISDWIKDQQYLSLFASASTGAQSDMITFRLDKLVYTPEFYVNVTYLDENGNEIKDASGKPYEPRVTYQIAGESGAAVDYTVQNAEIPGYTFVEVKDHPELTNHAELKGQLDETNKTTAVTMVYKEAGHYEVTVDGGEPTKTPYDVQSIDATVSAPADFTIAYKDGYHITADETTDEGSTPIDIKQIDEADESKGYKVPEPTSTDSVIHINYEQNVDPEVVKAAINFDIPAGLVNEPYTGGQSGEFNLKNDGANSLAQAKANLKKLADAVADKTSPLHDQATTDNIQKATEDLQGAVNAAQTARDKAAADIKTTEETLAKQGADVADSTLLKTFKDGAHTTLDAANKDNGKLTAEVTKSNEDLNAIVTATGNIAEIIKAATDGGKIAEKTVIPVNNEPLYTQDMTDYATMLGDATTTLDQLKAFAKQLQDDVLKESDKRKQVVQAGQDLIAGKTVVNGSNLTNFYSPKTDTWDFTELRTSATTLKTDIANALTDDQITTQTIDDANAAVNKALTDVTNAVTANSDALKAADTYLNEPQIISVIDQMNGFAGKEIGLAELTDLTKALTTALTSAINERQTVQNSAKDKIEAIKATGAAIDPILQDAIDMYGATKKAANSLSTENTDHISTADEKTAADKITVVEAALNAEAAAKKAGVDNETDVATAITALTTVLNDKTATNDAITAATTSLTGVTASATKAREDAKSAANNAVDGILAYQNEPVGGGTLGEENAKLTVLIANADNAAAKDHGAATTDAIKTATGTISTDLGTAKTKRDTVTADGSNTIKTIQGRGAVPAEVAAAITGYQQAVDDATAGTGSTALIADALKRLKDIDAASKYNNELGVSKALTDLDNAVASGDPATIATAEEALEKATTTAAEERNKIDNELSNFDAGSVANEVVAPATGTLAARSADLKADMDRANDPSASDRSDVTNAKMKSKLDQLQNDLQTAQTERQNAIDDGNKAADDAEKSAYKDDDGVKTAVANYRDVVAKAGNASKTTQDVIDAATAITTAINQATRNTAGNVDTSPYDKEKEVDDAKTALKAVVDNPDAKDADIEKATADLTNAVAKAKTARDNVIATGDGIVAKVTADIEDNPAVAEALAKYNEAKDNAENDTGTTQQIEDAGNALQAAITNATDTLKKARTALASTKPYSLETDVKTAKEKLQALVDNPASTSDDLDKATTDLTNAWTTAKTNRDGVIDAGKTVVDGLTPELAKNPVVAKAVTDLGNAEKTAEADNGTTQDIQNALDKLKKTITAVTNANSVGTKPYSKEQGVIDAKTALDQAVADDGSTPDDLAKATTDLNNAWTTAKTNRDGVIKEGQTVVNGLTPELAKNPVVAKAVTDLDDVEKTAEADNGTTQDIQNALDKLKNTITAVTNANSVGTKPYSKEEGVIDAKTALDQAVADEGSTPDDLAKATTDLTNAWTTAKTNRDGVIKEGQTVVTGLTPELAKNPVVAKAVADLDDVEKTAEADNGTTQDIQNALDKLKNTITAVTNANSVGTKPYSNEQGVIDAKTALDQAVADEGSTPDAITTAATALNKAKEDAKTARDKVIATGDGLKDSIKDTDLAKNPAVAQAVSDYENAKTDAGEDKVPTAEIEKAADKLKTAINAAKNAKDDANSKLGSTSPYSLEPDVKAAKDKLQALVDNPASKTEDLTADTTALDTAMKQAETERTQVIGDGDAIEGSIKDTDFAKNPAVVQAVNDYEKAKTNASADEGTTAKIKEAADKLQGAIDNAKKTIDDAKTKMGKTAPYSLETTVEDAKDKLKKLIDTPTSTNADITAATTALGDALTQAATDRDGVITAGDQIEDGVKDDELAKNPAVAQAIKDYETSKTNADDDKGTTAEIQAAADKLKGEIDNAKKTIDDAKNLIDQKATAPYSHEPAVELAKNNLVTLLDNPESTNKDIEELTTALGDALTAAKNLRDKVETSVDTIADNIDSAIKDNPAVVKAVQDYEDAKTNAAADNGTTRSVATAGLALQSAIDNATSVIDNAKKLLVDGATTPYSLETAVKDAKDKLQNLVDEPTSTNADITAATKALGDALTQAASDRNDVIAAGDQTEDGVKTTDLAKNPDVAQAIKDYDDAKTNAADDKGTTAEIKAAADKLQGAIDKAKKTLDDAKTKMGKTAPYSLEPDVKTAKDKLQKLIDTPTSTNADITAATTVLGDARTKAETERNGVIATGNQTEDGVKTTDLAKNPAVAQAIKDYDDAKTNAAADKGTTAEIKAAADKLQGAIDNAKKTIDDAKTKMGETAPYSLEPAVKGAKDKLQKLIDDPISTNADITAATTALGDALTKAETERNGVIAAGDQTEDGVKTTNLANNPAVAQAIKDYDDAKTNAAADNGTTAAIKNAADKLNSAIDDAQKLIHDANAKLGSTSPYSLEPDVKAAKDKLQKLIDKPSSTNDDINQATNDLGAAIDHAKEVRGKVIDNGDKITNEIGEDIKDNPAVVKALKDYDDAKTNAAANQGTTRQIIDAGIALQGAIDHATKVIDDAKKLLTDGATAPYSLETAVKEAKDKLQSLVDEPASTNADITAATTALGDALIQAESDRNGVIAAGDKTEDGVKTTDLAKNPAVAQAIKDYDQAKTNAADDKGTTAEIKAAADKLQGAIDKAKKTIDDAKTKLGKTAPYSLEPDVETAKDKLQKLIDTPSSANEDITNATTALDDALTQAATDRDTVIAAGDQT